MEKRRLMSSKKAIALKSMIQEHTDPSVYIRNQAYTNLIIIIKYTVNN
jgi:hypothetical protein